MAAAKGGSRLGLYLGVAAAGAGGYYLYRAGGNPRVAEKEMEHDASRLSARIKGELPGKESEAKAKGKLLAADIGAKVDKVVDDLKSTTHNIDAKVEGYIANTEKKLDHYKKEVTQDMTQAANKFDKTVETNAKAAKRSWSDWFNGK